MTASNTLVVRITFIALMAFVLLLTTYIYFSNLGRVNFGEMFFFVLEIALIALAGTMIWVGAVLLSCKVLKKKFQLRLKSPLSWIFVIITVGIFALLVTSCQCAPPIKDDRFSGKLKLIKAEDLIMDEEPKFIENEKIGK